MKQSVNSGGFICVPHLPQGKVSLALVSGQCPNEILSSLRKLGVTPLKTQCDPALQSPVAYHADMLCHHCGGAEVLLAPSQTSLMGELSEHGFSPRYSSPLGNEYPRDIALDCLRLGKFFFAKHGCADPVAASSAESKGCGSVSVTQGYVKCSVCVVGEKAVITEDEALYAEFKSRGIDALLIHRGYVGISRYDCGFIGGASGKLSADSVAFFGDCSLHPDWRKIEEFLAFHGCKAIFLSSEPLFDYGGIIPLKELT